MTSPKSRVLLVRNLKDQGTKRSTRRAAPRPDAPDFDHADRIGEFWGNPKTRTFAEIYPKRVTFYSSDATSEQTYVIVQASLVQGSCACLARAGACSRTTSRSQARAMPKCVSTRFSRMTGPSA